MARQYTRGKLGHFATHFSRRQKLGHFDRSLKRRFFLYMMCQSFKYTKNLNLGKNEGLGIVLPLGITVSDGGEVKGLVSRHIDWSVSDSVSGRSIVDN